MPKVNLTDAFCRSAKAEDGKVTEFADAKERGLALRVTPNVARSWTFRYRNAAGKQKRISLGRLDELSLAAARAKAAQTRVDILNGLDPADMRLAAKFAFLEHEKLETIGEIAERYMAAAVDGAHRFFKNEERPKKASTLANEWYYLNRFIIPDLGKAKLDHLNRHSLQEYIDSVRAKHSKSSARQCYVLLKGIYGYAVWKEHCAADPMQFVSAPGFKDRKRLLSDAEIMKVWLGLMHAEMCAGLSISRPVALALMLCLVTAQRRGEISGLRKDEIDLNQEYWILPEERSKNRTAHVAPLSAMATNLIEAAWSLSGDSPYLFPSPRKKDKPITGHSLSRAFNRLTKWFGISDCRVHDLRRTASTTMVGIGVSAATVSRILNHTTREEGEAQATKKSYNLYAYLPEKRSGLDRWDAHLSKIIKRQERPKFGQYDLAGVGQ
ncbi:tyrosine-type recombinase/integrase [Jiella sonneratiae]|uniref:Tyrosine-type recombinase/integrase n=1 Tax=Jiella sonneratiae TaxID=2816856 RepID=A0ABS3J2D3_9HYPH|nr:site-specific integrase [Jiella sonneratiae]MBO0903798.1 tyrosine-type recombinase/integrase [Jiella sonneratiae]